LWMLWTAFTGPVQQGINPLELRKGEIFDSAVNRFVRWLIWESIGTFTVVIAIMVGGGIFLHDKGFYFYIPPVLTFLTVCLFFFAFTLALE